MLFSFFILFSLFILRWVFSLVWSLLTFSAWLPSELQRPRQSPLKEIGIPRVCHHTWLFYVASGYQTYVLAFAKQTLMELSPLSSTFEFIFPFEIYDIFIKHDFFSLGIPFSTSLFGKSNVCPFPFKKQGRLQKLPVTESEVMV